MTPDPSVYAGYASRGRNAAWRYVLATCLALVFATLLSLAVGVVLMLTHSLPADLAQQMQHPTRPVTFLAATGGIFGILLAGFALAIFLVHGKSPRDVVGEWRWRRFFQGAALWTVALVALTGVDLLLAPHGFALTATRQTPLLAFSALLALAPQTFAEEFVFRGYLTQGLLLATGRPWAAAAISGALFGALHIANGAPQALSAAVFGVVLAVLAIRTGGIAFTFGLHLINNWFGAAVVVSGGDLFHGLPGLATQNTPQLMWWDTATAAAALLALAFLMGVHRSFSARSLQQAAPGSAEQGAQA
jgi:membrane protease YdiL (CAAX protease family)